MSVRNKILFSALLSCGVAFAATAATPNTPDSAASPKDAPHHVMKHPGGPGAMAGQMLLDGPFLQAIHQLNLSANQQSTIHGYLETARQQMHSGADARMNIETLANPGDPNYVSAVAAAKASAASRIQQRSDLQVQIYGLLTPEQQAKLPQVLTEMKTQHARHHAESTMHHEPAPATN
jgi:Spy/CpxP family protein refolding chaperone